MADTKQVMRDAIFALLEARESINKGIASLQSALQQQETRETALRMAGAAGAVPDPDVVGVLACPKGKGECASVLPDKRCFDCPSRNAGVATCPHGVPHRWPCEKCDTASGVLAAPTAPTLICPKCKVDRFLEACPAAFVDCPMLAQAQGNAGVALPDGAKR